jgi:hypothetical protein
MKKHISQAHLDAVCASGPSQQVIQFKMDGLVPDYSQDGVFQLTVDMAPLNLSMVFDTLREQGIAEDLAGQACDQMSEFIFARQLGEHFARNMKRVG